MILVTRINQSFRSLKRAKLPLSLLFTIILGESYRFVRTPELNEKKWFLFIDLAQDLEWYVKDTSEGLIWIIFLIVWIIREKGRSKFWSWLIGLFLVFRVVDLCAYWVNHRHAGLVYFFCYFSIIIYVGQYIITKHKFNTNEKGG